MTIMGSSFRPTKTFVLSDSDGVDGVIIKNSKGFTVAKIDSNGNIKYKGRMIKD